VTIVALPGGADRRALIGADGREIARFRAGDHEGRPIANDFELGVTPEEASAPVLAELAGWRIAVDEPFGRLLVIAGGRPKRHAHTLSRDLVRDPAPPGWLAPPLPPGMRLTPVDRPALDLAPACKAAYPRDHIDFASIPSPEHPEIELDDIISGRLLGPLLPCSGLTVRDDGAVVAAILVNDDSDGPWISQFFRHPDARGAGVPLLRRALALATRDGLPAIGLAVTDGNRAHTLYDAHGFAELRNSLTVEL
jgi:hypothetical protein